jgi:hypothetical protein
MPPTTAYTFTPRGLASALAKNTAVRPDRPGPPVILECRSAEWKPKSERLAPAFDEIGLEQALENVAGLLLVPQGPSTPPLNAAVTS